MLTAFAISATLRCCQNGPSSDIDHRMMRRCVELASRAQGQTRPNPVVGCVLMNENGLVVGEGFHERAGGPHAEVVALRYAGEAAKNGTAYVSLEPCNHFGRTPPCTDALLRAEVQRVVVGMVDPDPRTAGGGIARLRENGIQVDVGIEESRCREANAGFISRILHKKPLGTWKYAMTLDGKIAADSGSSKWVSGPSSRSLVQKIRTRTDAIIVGGNTVRMDDPRLTVREGAPGAVKTLRVVMSRSMDLPRNARLWDTAEAPTFVYTAIGSKPDFREYLRSRGVEVIELEEPTPAAVMKNLYELGALNVLWECGGGLAAEAVRDGSIQRVAAFIAPKLIGGGTYTPLSNIGLDDMQDAITLKNMQVETCGDDLAVFGDLVRTGR